MSVKGFYLTGAGREVLMLHRIVKVLVRLNDVPSGAIGDVRAELDAEHAELLTNVLAGPA